MSYLFIKLLTGLRYAQYILLFEEKMAARKENKNMILSLKPYRLQMCSTESRENERNVLKTFFFGGV